MAKILVIDDEPSILNMLGQALRRYDHEVWLATGGQSGIDIFHSVNPDVTILDLHMPHIGGLEVLRQIRGLAPQAPVLILTGFATEVNEQAVRRLGVSEFLKKGFSLHELGAALRRVLAESSQKAPDKPLREARRNHPRASIGITVRYLPPNNQFVESLTGDIGGGGVFIQTTAPLTAGTDIAMKLLLPDDPSKSVLAKGHITWARLHAVGARLPAGMGVQFTDIASPARARLLDLVHSLNKTRQMM